MKQNYARLAADNEGGQGWTVTCARFKTTRRADKAPSLPAPAHYRLDLQAAPHPEWHTRGTIATATSGQRGQCSIWLHYREEDYQISSKSNSTYSDLAAKTTRSNSQVRVDLGEKRGEGWATSATPMMPLGRVGPPPLSSTHGESVDTGRTCQPLSRPDRV